MKTENEITVRTKSRGEYHDEKLPLVEMKDTLDGGGRITLLIRHAEHPPLDPIRATSPLAQACRSRKTAGVGRTTLV